MNRIVVQVSCLHDSEIFPRVFSHLSQPTMEIFERLVRFAVSDRSAQDLVSRDGRRSDFLYQGFQNIGCQCPSFFEPPTTDVISDRGIVVNGRVLVKMIDTARSLSQRSQSVGNGGKK